MKRDEQRKLKVLRSSLMKIAQPYIKQYGWKKKDFMIWLIKDGLFFSLLLFIGEKDGQCFLTSRGTVKPLWGDDILWEILGIEENKKAPLSLRSIGAFTLHGAEIYDNKYELLEWELFELEMMVEKIATEFQAVVQKTSIDDFYCLAEKTLYQNELLKSIILIHQKKYKEAVAFVSAMESEYFSNEGGGFKERALKYIKENLSE